MSFICKNTREENVGQISKNYYLRRGSAKGDYKENLKD